MDVHGQKKEALGLTPDSDDIAFMQDAGRMEAFVVDKRVVRRGELRLDEPAFRRGPQGKLTAAGIPRIRAETFQKGTAYRALDADVQNALFFAGKSQAWSRGRRGCGGPGGLRFLAPRVP